MISNIKFLGPELTLDLNFEAGSRTKCKWQCKGVVPSDYTLAPCFQTNPSLISGAGTITGSYWLRERMGNHCAKERGVVVMQ